MRSSILLHFLSCVLLLLQHGVHTAASVNNIHKCCPANQLLDLHTKHCIDQSIVDHQPNLTVQSFDLDKNQTTQVSLLSETTAPASPWMLCEIKDSYHLKDFNHIKMGTRHLFWNNINQSQIPNKDFCLDDAYDFVTKEETSVIKLCLPCSTRNKTCLNFCEEKEEKDNEDVIDEEKLPLQSNISYMDIFVPLHCTEALKYPEFTVTKQGVWVDGDFREFSEYCIHRRNQSWSVQLCRKKDDVVDPYKTIKIVFMTLSLISFSILLAIHILIKELWRKDFNKLKIPFYLSGFMSFISLLVSNINDIETNYYLCMLLGLMIQYWSLVMFFSLTIMNRDMWIRFRTMTNPLERVTIMREQKRRERIWANVLSFGLPFIIGLVTIAMQTLIKESEDDLTGDAWLNPRLERNCHLSQYWPQFLYFHLILLLLLSANLLFYILFVKNYLFGIWSQDMNDGNIRVVLELVLVMGLSWLTESVGFFLRWNDDPGWHNPVLVFLYSFNQLTGVFILIAFFLRTNNRLLVWDWMFSASDEYETELGTNLTNLSNPTGERADTWKMT